MYHITALSNSVKLWAMLFSATQDIWNMVENSNKTWSTGEENGNHFSILAWEPHEQYKKSVSQLTDLGGDGLTVPEIRGNLKNTVLFSYFKIIHLHIMLN